MDPSTGESSVGNMNKSTLKGNTGPGLKFDVASTLPGQFYPGKGYKIYPRKGPDTFDKFSAQHGSASSLVSYNEGRESEKDENEADETTTGSDTSSFRWVSK